MQKVHLSFITLLLLVAFASFGAMLPTAALPAIGLYFKVNNGAAENVMAWYLMGYALAQLAYGPLANSLGRRRALLIGACLAVISSIISLFAAYWKIFDLYLVMRLLNGFGAGSGLIIGMILIKDIHEPTAARKIFARVILTFAAVPFIATSLGGILTRHGGWQSLNAVLVLYACLIFILTLRVPETLTPSKRIRLSLPNLATAYRQLFQNRAYLKLVGIFAFGAVLSYGFNGLAPLFVIHTLHVSEQTYGYLSFLPAFGLFLGGYISQHFATKLSASILLKYALGLMLISTLVLSISFLCHYFGLILFYGMSTLLFCGQAMVSANAGMEALSHVTDHANGSSFMNALALIAGSVFVAVMGHLFSLSVLVLPLSLLVVSLLSIGLLMDCAKTRLFLLIKNRSSP